jgi:polysaccharide chain length determinant protein (PEP-CTERM system associated)
MSVFESNAPLVADYLGALKRRYIYLATILPGVVFLCVIAAFAIHPQFQATATIELELSSVPKDIIESTVVSFADQQIEIVQGRVMTVESLMQIVKQVDPYPRHPEWTDAQKAQRILDDTTLEHVDPVSLKPMAESSAFSLHYNNNSPALAKDIDMRLAQLFLTYNQARRTEAASEAAGFLQKEAETVNQQMRDVDAKLADLRRKYGEALPEFLARNQADAEDTQRQLDGLQQQILTAQEKESVLSVQLSQLSPNLITQSGDLTDIATVRAKLTEAEQRYTPDHPEVKRLRRALETLMEQSAHSGASTGIAQGANNPQYNLTATELQAARNELAGLKQQAAALQSKLAQSHMLVAMTPSAEREFGKVMRRKAVLQSEYQQVQDKLANANLAQTFESHQGGERFVLLRAPAEPKLPVYPNRIGLILLGLVFGAAVAGIAVAVSEGTDKSVRTARDLALPADVPVLSSIPFIDNTSDRRRHALKVGSFIAAYSIAIVTAVAVIISAGQRDNAVASVGKHVDR